MRHLQLLLSGLAALFFTQTTSAQGVLRQEAYRFEVSEVPRDASLGQGLAKFVEDTLGQVWADNSVHLLKLGKRQTEIFALAGAGVLQGYIIRLFTDQYKHIWVSTNKGLYHLDPLTQRFTPHIITLDSQVIRSQAIHSFGAYIFAATGKGEIIRYHPGTKKATLLQTGIRHGFIPFLHRTSLGSVFFSDRTHLYQITDSNRIKRICALPPGQMPFQAETLDGNFLYISTLGGPILKVNLQTGQLLELPLANKAIDNGTTIAKVNWLGKNYIVQGTGNGMVWIDPTNDAQIFWNNNPLQKGNTLIGQTGSALQDKYGRLWIGSGENCLSLIPVEANTTPIFLHEGGSTIWDPANPEGPSALANDNQKNQIVYGIGDTLVFFDKASAQITSRIVLGEQRKINQILQTPNGDWIAATTNGLIKVANRQAKNLSDSLNGKNVIRLLQKGDTLFAGTYSHGLFTILQDGTIIETHGKATGMTGNHFPALCLDKQGRLWMINGRSSLYVRNGTKPEMVPYDSKALGLAFVYDIQCDADSNKIWMGGEGGIQSYNPATQATADITTSVPNGFEFGIYRMYPKKDAKMFITTTGNKLFEWDLKTRKVLNISMEKGWWSENLYSISYIDADEKGVWWGTFRYGLMKFNTNSFMLPAKPQTPQIRSIQIKYSPWDAHPATYLDNPLQLSYLQSPLSVVCSSINNGHTQFRLDGYEDGWHTGERATYTNLREGNYTFKARTIDQIGNVSEEQTMMVKVLPPWWRTWWFRLLASLTLAGLLYAFFRKIIAGIEKENNYKIRLAKSELTAIRSQMNPHFIFNCMTAIDGLIAKNEREKASEYLGKFSKLLRQVLQQSSRQFISLGEDLDTLNLYLQLEQLRIKDGFSFNIAIPDALRHEIEVPPLLLQPMVENAIIHGLRPKQNAPKHLTVSCKKENGTITFRVEDTGIGRKASAELNSTRNDEHKSVGNKLTMDRLKMLEDVSGYKTHFETQDLYDDEGNATGTATTLTIQTESNE